MAKRTRNIEPWEAAIIKAMLEDGSYTRDKIVAYFSRPERTINPARIYDIEHGKIHSDVPSANEAQLSDYLLTFQTPSDAARNFFKHYPLHRANVETIFSPKRGDLECLEVDETHAIECKQSLNFINKALYARIIAGLANNNGGFILFGVENSEKRVVGIPKGKLSSYDSAKLNQFLSSHFTPAPRWEKSEVVLCGQPVGFVYVYPANAKPVICTKDAGSELREGDIYYRYPGETTRIKYAELLEIISERVKEMEGHWASLLSRVENAGVSNVAILNTETGDVSGRGGNFLIDEALIPKLKFLSEGEFSETEGAPTLRLVGDLKPANIKPSGEIQTNIKKVHISDFDLVSDFLHQNAVPDPEMYIRHLAHSAKVWLPVFYYIEQANITKEDAVNIVLGEKSSKPDHIKRLVYRIENTTFPAGTGKRSSVPGQLENILSGRIINPKNEDECIEFLKAVRVLSPEEVDLDQLAPTLRYCSETFSTDKATAALRYAATHLDVAGYLLKSSESKTGE